MFTLIDLLRGRLQEPLPGRAAQNKMASLRRLEELAHLTVPPPDARVACVLNLLHWEDGEWRTVLIQRTINPRDRHSGQISFPGGRFEEADGSLEQVALRETEEEVGIPRHQVEIIGRLTELYIPVSNYVVHPFVGVLNGPKNFVAQPGEVAAILTPPIAAFTDQNRRKVTDMYITQGITLKQVPYFELEGRTIWGATAMILSEFVEVMTGSGVAEQ